jgi:hypothetical protein
MKNITPNSTIKTTWSKAEPLTDILQEQVALDVPFQGHL